LLLLFLDFLGLLLLLLLLLLVLIDILGHDLHITLARGLLLMNEEQTAEQQECRMNHDSSNEEDDS